MSTPRLDQLIFGGEESCIHSLACLRPQELLVLLGAVRVIFPGKEEAVQRGEGAKPHLRYRRPHAEAGGYRTMNSEGCVKFCVCHTNHVAD